MLNHTMTSEGKVPHHVYSGIECPVKLDIRNPGERELNGLFPPLRKDDKLVYALPGGGELCL